MVKVEVEKIANNNAPQEQGQPQPQNALQPQEQTQTPQQSSNIATNEELMNDEMVKRAMELFQPKAPIDIKDTN